MKDKFNKYCYDVMGYQDYTVPTGYTAHIYRIEIDGVLYNPYDDLNQRMPVFDKLFTNKLYGGNHQNFNLQIYCHGIDKATKDFIISTMEKK